MSSAVTRLRKPAPMVTPPAACCTDSRSLTCTFANFCINRLCAAMSRGLANIVLGEDGGEKRGQTSATPIKILYYWIIVSNPCLKLRYCRNGQSVVSGSIGIGINIKAMYKYNVWMINKEFYKKHHQDATSTIWNIYEEYFFCWGQKEYVYSFGWNWLFYKWNKSWTCYTFFVSLKA